MVNLLVSRSCWFVIILTAISTTTTLTKAFWLSGNRGIAQRQTPVLVRNNRIACHDNDQSRPTTLLLWGHFQQQPQQPPQPSVLDNHHVWFYDDDAPATSSPDAASRQSGIGWRRATSHNNHDNHDNSMKSVYETCHWCQHFVVPLQLCPWAAASVATPGAMHFYVVPNNNVSPNQNKLEAIVESVAQQFVAAIQDSRSSTSVVDLTKVAIAFIILLPPNNNNDNDNQDATTIIQNDSWYQSFDTFYDWFVRFEDDWIDQADANINNNNNNNNNVQQQLTVACFHPSWEFSEADEGMNFEKTSPHPTLSLVWTDTIDAAGTEATERIAQHNAHVLQEELTLTEIQTMYSNAIRGCPMKKCKEG